ncbi:MAG: hypothetical protein V4603_13375, partial [Pseudomonadota bacterium]
ALMVVQKASGSYRDGFLKLPQQIQLVCTLPAHFPVRLTAFLPGISPSFDLDSALCHQARYNDAYELHDYTLPPFALHGPLAEAGQRCADACCWHWCARPANQG